MYNVNHINDKLFILYYALYPSAPITPVDHGIQTIHKYYYIHNSKTRSHAISTNYCSWQEGAKFKTHLIYTQSCPYICCPEICDRCSSHNIILTSNQEEVLADLFKKCNEVAKWEEETGKRSPDLPTGSSSPTSRLPTYVSYPNYSNGRFIPSGTNKVLDRLVDNYSMPKSSTSTSDSTSTVTASSATSEPSTTTTTANPAEASTSQDDRRKTEESKPGNTFADLGFNNSASVFKEKNQRRSSKPGLNFICSTWYG